MSQEIDQLKRQLREAHEKIAELEALLQNDPASLARRYAGYTPQESKIIGMLLSFNVVLKDKIMEVLYDESDNAPDPKIADVYICKIRKKLEPYEIEIKTAWGTGWFMEPYHRFKLKELLGFAQEENAKPPA